MGLQDIDLKGVIERETGNKFNRFNKSFCPFHHEKTPSLSVKFFPDANKQRFICYGCKESGDAIDFIMKFKGLEYLEAKKYLGLPVEETEKDKIEEKVKKYISWELTKFREGQELLGLFTFVTEKNEIAYFKAKFKKTDGNKDISYYSIENDKVISKRLCEELPYNYYRTLEASRFDKVIVVCEGEKDANTINSLLRKEGYEATSFKSVKQIKLHPGAAVYICSDTGKAGEAYKWEVYNALKDHVRILKFINLPGIKDLGDNKDVTDWIEAGHDKKDLINAFSRSLDLKCKWELQQDAGGIYKTIVKMKDDEPTETKKKYITNFKLKEAKKIIFADEDQEGIKLVLKSATGQEIERVGISTVFDDVRTFKNFLGTIDLAFMGRIDDLTEFKTWINKYWALENEEMHQGIRFIRKGEEILLVTNEGAISKDNIIETIRSDGRNEVGFLGIDFITKEELKEVKKHLFKFSLPEKTLSIVGTVINNLAIIQNKELKQKLHHLLIIGQAGSGKSTVLENVIAPILNYPLKDKKSIGLISPFALIKNLSDGNYPILFDEFKPSVLDRYKIAKLSENFRNLYDRATVSRGDKSFRSKDFQLNRPLILVGEESYPNQEQALIERSCIVYLSTRERDESTTAAIEWIMKNELILNKLGRSLLQIILELKTEDYKLIRDKIEKNINGLKNRVLSTAINIASGIEIFNLLCKKLEVKEIRMLDTGSTKGYLSPIVQNLKTEVLEDGVDTKSIVERMLMLYNDMIEDGRASNPSDVIRIKPEAVYIRTSEMINQINEHVIRVGADLIPLKMRDFKKQAEKAGYITEIAKAVIKIGMKTVRFDTYNKERLRDLKLTVIAPNDYEELTLEESKDAPF